MHIVPSGVYEWSVNPFTNLYPVYIHTQIMAVRNARKTYLIPVCSAYCSLTLFSQQRLLRYVQLTIVLRLQ
jgi:hypothetical protein